MLEGKEGPWPGSQEAPPGARSRSLPLAEEEGWPGGYSRGSWTLRRASQQLHRENTESVPGSVWWAQPRLLGRSGARSASRGQCLSRDPKGLLAHQASGNPGCPLGPPSFPQEQEEELKFGGNARRCFSYSSLVRISRGCSCAWIYLGRLHALACSLRLYSPSPRDQFSVQSLAAEKVSRTKKMEWAASEMK